MSDEVVRQARGEGWDQGHVVAAENPVEVESAFLPDTAIYESDDRLVLKLDLPGVEKGQVQIEMDETNTLQVRARNCFEEPSGILFREFMVGNFYRSFRLGQEFDKDSVTAKLEDGVLELTVAKREEPKPRRISITA